MSLYTAPSLIKKLILEAENLTLNPNIDAQETQDFTNSTTPAEVASDISNATSASGGTTPGLQGSTLTMPQVAAPPATVSKTVINKDIILSQLAELKSLVTNYEKKFDGIDLTPQDANVYISSLLSTLVFHAEKLNSFMESTPTEETATPVQPVQEEQPLLNTPPQA